MESEVKAERVRSKIEQSARAGKQMGGGNRPYGYAIEYKIVSQPGEKVRRRITRVAVNPIEGPIVAECAKRVLAGESLHSVCRDLNDRRIPTSAGGQWQHMTLRRMLCSARISGRRQYIAEGSFSGPRPLVGEIVADESEWPAIITAEQSDRLRTLLTRPDRRTTPGSARKALLSGILHCARCGHPMVSRPQSGRPRYVCNPDTGHGDACGRLTIDAARADAHVRDLVLAALDNPVMVARLLARDASGPDLHARIRADEDLLEALAADMGSGEISRAEWKAARTPIVARLEAARAQLAATTQTSALQGFVGSYDDMVTRWDAANTSQRRAVLTAALEKLIVHPATVRKFDPDRIVPVWQV